MQRRWRYYSGTDYQWDYITQESKISPEDLYVPSSKAHRLVQVRSIATPPNSWIGNERSHEGFENLAPSNNSGTP
jgi:hypothetical protein